MNAMTELSPPGALTIVLGHPGRWMSSLFLILFGIASACLRQPLPLLPSPLSEGARVGAKATGAARVVVSLGRWDSGGPSLQNLAEGRVVSSSFSLESELSAGTTG